MLSKLGFTLPVVLLLAACPGFPPMEPVTPSPVTSGDAGVAPDAGLPPPVHHRLKVGAWVSGDGLILPAGGFFDPVLNLPCSRSSDVDGVGRCFPYENMSYFVRAYSDDTCTTEVLVVEQPLHEGSMQGVIMSPDNNYPLRLSAVGAPLSGSTFWTKSTSAVVGCTMQQTHPTQGLFAVGMDLTPTLEVLELRWLDHL